MNYHSNGDERVHAIPWKEILGHEQRHVADRNEIVRSTVIPKIKEAEGGPYKSKRLCDNRRNQIRTAYQSWLDRAYSTYFYPSHDNDPNTTRPGEGEPYPPYPGTPHDPIPGNSVH